ncbi:predicted protein [Candida tropicalis MYA-3404]|uniref:Uncharacterized protein n=1 Tax=Candida tropicalis (strain ATCC MYA-3404 / T1) TaxID=294747 RepID=C5M487_CANTT|nr:predicted protein [Candida tropicalis MYA-3404]EER36137.1 predicted protein [Candida tropicalis MYA-3404]KAG4410256.1 hypothetical protein JTP64_000894 [Candida tropicalis]
MNMQWSNRFIFETFIEFSISWIVFSFSYAHTICKVCYIWLGNTICITFLHPIRIPTSKCQFIMSIPILEFLHGDIINFTNFFTGDIIFFKCIRITEVFRMFKDTNWICPTITIIRLTYTDSITFCKHTTIVVVQVAQVFTNGPIVIH